MTGAVLDEDLPVLAHLDISTSGRGRVLHVVVDRLVVGRSPRADVVLDADGRVSRVHAVLERLGGRWTVRDLGSRNGTFVDGHRVTEQVAVGSTSRIRVGDSVLTLRAARQAGDAEATEAQAPPPPVTVRERDVLLALFATMNAAEPFTVPASTREIARTLWISDAAVKQHLMRLYRKFGIEGTAEGRRMRLANAALQRGAITVADIRAVPRR